MSSKADLSQYSHANPPQDALAIEIFVNLKVLNRQRGSVVNCPLSPPICFLVAFRTAITSGAISRTRRSLPVFAAILSNTLFS